MMRISILILSYIVLLFTLIFSDGLLLADDAGHTTAGADTRTEACSEALKKAERKTEPARIVKHHVDIGECECEEHVDAETWEDRWTCMVRYETVDVGRTIYDSVH